ncbi:nephrocystin 1-like protein, partial [Reticulomyxa filosa]
MADSEKGDAMEEGGFQCTALTDYFSAAVDELDLRAGAIYTVIQTSPSGWWYAEDEDGQDGWVPSNYLVRLDEEGEDEREQAGNEEDKQVSHEASGSGSDVGDELDEEEKQRRKTQKIQKRALAHVRQVTLRNSIDSTASEGFAKAVKNMEESNRKISKRQEQ